MRICSLSFKVLTRDGIFHDFRHLVPTGTLKNPLFFRLPRPLDIPHSLTSLALTFFGSSSAPKQFPLDREGLSMFLFLFIHETLEPECRVAAHCRPPKGNRKARALYLLQSPSERQYPCGFLPSPRYKAFGPFLHNRRGRERSSGLTVQTCSLGPPVLLMFPVGACKSLLRPFFGPPPRVCSLSFPDPSVPWIRLNKALFCDFERPF